MEKNIKIHLNSNSIDDAIKNLKKLKSSLNELPMGITKEIADEGASKLAEQHGKYRHSDGNASIDIIPIEKGYRVSISSPSIIYEEFGTGDVGEKSNAPKSPTEFGLDYYRQHGTTIRPADRYSREHGINAGWYWTYQKDGSWVYTQGIPSGHFVYDTTQYLRKNYKKIAKEKASDVISKV